MAKKDIFALDADGVTFNCDKSFADVGSVVVGRPLIPLNNEYDLTKRYNVTEKEMHDTFDAMMHHELGWKGMELLPGAKDAFLSLQERYEIHIVTAIPEQLKLLREESYAVHGMFPTHIHCVGHHTASKVHVLKELNPVGFVDDRLKHLYEAPFIPHRAWVDHGDSQDGLVVDDTLYHTKSLKQFVDQWHNPQTKTRQSKRASF